MIILQRVQLSNFMSIEQADLTFESNEFVAIIGENGAGKSALLYALGLAFLEYKKGDTFKDFVKKGEGECRVYVEALVKGKPITIDIVISDRKYIVPMARTIVYENITYSNSECSVLLQSLDMEYLQHTMFLFQGDNSIVDLRPGERARMLRKLFHFEFDSQIGTLRDHIEKEHSRTQVLSITLEELSKQPYIEDPLLPTLSPEDSLRLSERKDLVERSLLSLQEVDSSQLTVIEEAFQERSRLSVATTQLVQTISQRITSNEAKLQSLSDEKSFLEGQVTTMRGELKVSIDDIEKGIEQVVAERGRIVAEKQTAAERIAEKKQHLSIYQTGVCYACGSEFTDTARIASLQVEIEALELKLSQAELAVGKLAASQAEMVTLKDNHRKALQRESSLRETITTISGSIIDIGHALESDQLSLKYELQNELRYAEEVTQLQGQLSDLGRVKEDVELRSSYEEELQLLSQQLSDDSQASAINRERTRKNLIVAQQRLDQQTQIKTLSQELEASAREEDILKQSLRLFEVDFPNFIILQTCSQIEAYMNAFIQRVFPYMSVKLQQSRSGVEFFYTPNLIEEDSWVSVKMASGAQASILSLSWRIAIAQIYGITTLLLDEVDESSTDENSRLIYEFIASLTSFNQIILISHKKEAVRAIAAIADNVRGFEVEQGIYTEINPENVE